MFIQQVIVSALIMVATGSVFAQSTSQAGCANPTPIFGRIVALCGNDRMITYVGDEPSVVLGIRTCTSRFELAYCYGGGGRMGLHLSTNSEGYVLKTDVYKRESINEQYTVSYTWGSFAIEGTDYYGQPYTAACHPYQDTRTNIEYLWQLGS